MGLRPTKCHENGFESEVHAMKFANAPTDSSAHCATWDIRFNSVRSALSLLRDTTTFSMVPRGFGP